MTTLLTHEASIGYEVEGRGNPIILLHGFASNRTVNWKITSWYKLLVRSGRRVVALDLRGHGESTKFHEPEDYAPERIVTDVISLMDHLAIDASDIMGYSLGGWISTHLMVSHPDRVRSVVLGGVGAHLLDYRERARMIALYLPSENATSIHDPFIRALREFADFHRNDLMALSACISRVYRDDPPDFRMNTKPVLVVSARDDGVVGDAYGFARTIPGAKLSIIPGCDHLTALMNPRYKEAVLNFLSQGETQNVP
ncbi:MAG: alpha/beta fold hydrolase [Desulfomonilia bacterium]